MIIPTYNKSRYLEYTLTGFLKQSFPHFEMIIIDDGSTDLTREVVRRFETRLSIKYVHQPNRGRSAARNNGLERAANDIVVFNDDDRIPAPDYMAGHIRTIQQAEQAKIVSIGYKRTVLSRFYPEISPYYVSKRENLLLTYAHFFERNPEMIGKFQQGQPFDLFTCGQLEDDPNGVLERYYLYDGIENFKWDTMEFGDKLTGFHFDWACATTGNMAFNAARSNNLRFDESYLGWGIEDNDFSYQLKLAGYEYALAKSAVNYHQEHPRESVDQEKGLTNVDRFIRKFDTIETYLYKKIQQGDVRMIEAHRMLQKFSEAQTRGREYAAEY
ncbi:glycosyltransferase family A protein [Paenibacillaceae bacterium WGS1546]|uniref:glycosyltransferase family A protein n=1 Tax=Cohnella sp. WGS1546 TaxID=3366810 RepID=UPI00372D2369